ncbi:PKD domain-containing protein [Geodermatophilus sp. SYSU D00779]
MSSVPVPHDRRTRRRRAGSTAVAGLLTAGLALLGLAVPGTAAADTRPVPPGEPATVAADALPTVQVNGVVWSQVVVGNTVYAAGRFSTARPAGAAAGTQETVRNNLLAYDIRTGALITSFAPDLNAQALTLAASPDGRRLYVGGDFTRANGQVRNRVAAYDTVTGALVPSFAPSVSSQVRALAATNDTVYLGGNFSALGGVSRSQLAAVRASDGGLLPWAPVPGPGSTAGNRDGNTATSSEVMALVVTGGGSQVVAAGRFDTLNGAKATGVGALDAATGATRPFAINQLITNQGVNSAVYSLSTDGTAVYGTGYDYFGPGNFEGSFAARADGGAVIAVNGCHGDSYSSYPVGGVLYIATHAHTCEPIGGYPEQTPRVNKFATAVTTTATGTTTDPSLRNTNLRGQPAPTLLPWFPTMSAGQVTGQLQAGWSVSGNSQYVVFGGEFPRVNGVAQEGLVRYAVSSLAPNDRGPETTAAALRPNATSTTAGQVTVTWPAAWDMDNAELTYQVLRDGGTTPVHTVTATSSWWDRPELTFTDPRPAGSTASYRVVVTDPFGNTVTSSPSNTVTVASATSAYANRVLADAPDQYWRLGEPSGTTALDHAGTTNLTTGTGVTRGTAGAVGGDTAVTANGTATGIASTRAATVPTPANAFSVEAWVRTTSSGLIAQYSDSPTAAATNPAGAATAVDRSLYVDAEGRLTFGTKRGTTYRTVRSPGRVDDGAWHHVVATVSGTGAALHVDGARVATEPTFTTANANLAGYWHLAGGSLTGWPGAPASASLAGSLDEVAIYSTTLTAEQVQAHHATATGAPTPNAAPTARFTATTDGLRVAVDAAASTDPDGTVAAVAWDFGDGGTGTGTTASHTYAAAGTYPVTVTVTDDDGATARTSQQVTVTAPPPTAPAAIASDAFGRTVSGGLGTADVGGPWTATAGATRLSVAPGTATLALPAAGNNTGAYLGQVAQTGVDVRTSFSLSSMPTGGGTYVYVTGRRVSAGNEYRVLVKVMADGRVSLTLSRLAGGTEAWPGGEVVVPGLTYRAGTTLHARVQVTGTGTTDVAATVWADGTAEPATPQLVRTDTTAALQAPGSVGLAAYRPTSATASTAVRVTGFAATAPGAGGGQPPAPNQAPTATATAATSGLSVSVDGSGSTDPDGTVRSYAWTFGDGGTATGVTATHTYAAAGTYPVTLTVTDDDGATATTSRAVTVAAGTPPPGPVDPAVIAADAFGRTVTGGLGTADVGGPWTASAGATRQSVTPGTATLTAGPGNNTGSYLGSVAQTSADVRTSFSLGSVPTGGGTYVYVTGRRVSAGNEYRVAVKVGSAGQVSLVLSRLSGGTEAWPGGEVVVPGLTYRAGTTLHVRVRVSGTGTTDVAASVWADGAAEPATPQLVRTDTTAALQAPGSVGLAAYTSGTATAPVAVRVTALEVRPAG